MEEYFERALRDLVALAADEAWVLHFTVGRETEGTFEYPFPKKDSPVKVIHIFHNRTFTSLCMVYRNDGDDNKVTEDIEL